MGGTGFESSKEKKEGSALHMTSAPFPHPSGGVCVFAYDVVLFTQRTSKKQTGDHSSCLFFTF